MTSKDYFDQITKIEGRKSLTKLSDRKHMNDMETGSRKGEKKFVFTPLTHGQGD